MDQITVQNRFGKTLRAMRTRAGMSQVTLARKAGLHCSFINSLEQGKKNISLLNMYRLAAALSITISDLFSSPINGETIKAVLFDLHYTLIRPNPSRGIVYGKVLRQHGLRVHPRKTKRIFNEIWDSYGDSKISTEHATLRDEKGMEQWWLGFHKKMLARLGYNNKRGCELINSELSRDFYTNPKVHRVYADAMEILTILRKQGVKLALVTNGYKTTKKVIRDMGLEKYFDCIVISSAVGISKPDPKIFKIAINKLGLKPAEVLFVGDSYATDIVGAKRAGCKAAIIDRKYSDRKKRYDCIYLNNLLQIKSLI